MSTEYRGIFISDVHLLSYDCNASALSAFLDENKAKSYCLVGDILDEWSAAPPSLEELSRFTIDERFYFPTSQSELMNRIKTLYKDGNDVRYIIGNHDEFLEDYLGDPSVSSLMLCKETTYTSLDGRKFLVIHGHQLDGFIKYCGWFAHLAHFSYNVYLAFSNIFKKLSRIVGMRRQWSLADYLSDHLHEALNVEKELIVYAKSRGFNGIICGHTHIPSIHTDEDGFVYANCGDWVRSNTVIVETMNGEIRLHIV